MMLRARGLTVGSLVLLAMQASACASSHVFSKSFAPEGAPAGRVIFYDAGRFRGQLQGAEKYMPLLFYKKPGGKWSGKLGKGFSWAFQLSPWFAVETGIGPQQFRLQLGDAVEVVDVPVKRGHVAIVSYLVRHGESATTRTGRLMTFKFETQVEPSVPVHTEPDAERRLVEALAAAEMGVRFVACQELGQLRLMASLSEAALAKLRMVAESDPAQAVREAAAVALTSSPKS